MIEWIDVDERLPEDGEWVLGYFPDKPWGAGEEKWRHKCDVVRFVRGLSYEDRRLIGGSRRALEHRTGDQSGNNRRPYSWEAFGAMIHFGQDCAKWARLDSDPVPADWTEGNLVFSMHGAFDVGQIDHPQKVMRELGIAWDSAEPQPIAEQWKFIGCRSKNGCPIALPRYIRPFK